MAKKQRDQLSFRITPVEKRSQFVGKVHASGLTLQQVLTDLVDAYLELPPPEDIIDIRHLDSASLRALQVLLATSETELLMRYLAEIVESIPEELKARALRTIRGNLEIYKEIVTFGEIVKHEGSTSKRKRGSK